MLPILISLSVAPGSYFFCAAAGSMLMERPSTIDASRMPRDCAMSTSLNAVGCLPIMRQSRVLALNLSSYRDFRYTLSEHRGKADIPPTALPVLTTDIGDELTRITWTAKPTTFRPSFIFIRAT